MGKIFKYLKEYKAIVAGIILLLIVQAYCDLSLPQYMSDIVDIGIQQGGIEHVAPEEMREETLENLCVFMSDEDAETVKGAYEKNEEGNYELTVKKDEIEKLDEILGLPMLVMSSMEEQEGMDMETIRAALESGMMTKEQILQQEDAVEEQLGDMSDTIINQKALLVVKSEYEALGWDMGDYQNSYMLRTGGKMIAMSVIMMAAAIFAGMLASYVSAGVGRDLRDKVFKKVVSFSNSEIERFSTASLITRSTNDIQQIQMVEVMLLRMVIYAPIIGIGGVIKVANTRTGMSWIIGVAVGVIILVVGLLMVVAMPKFKKMQTLVDRLNLVSREILTGVPVIRAFSREKFEEKRFEGANKELMKTQLFTNRVMSMMMPLMMMMIMNCITVAIVWFGSKGVDLGNLQVGDMMAFITYTMIIVMSFLMITMVSVMLPRAGVAANRIDEVLNTEAEILDPKEPKDGVNEQWKGEIVFDDVCFQYPGADENAIEHISFKAEPGKTTAIIGSTGCGKSTLLNLIPRFYDVTEGKITVDGVDIRDITQNKLRSLLGYVPQKGVLFSGTIATNIGFAGEVSEEKIQEAAQIAQAEEFISAKEEGYESPIAQGGTNVSGGQKQRLSIARAIAKNPKVFLFDDSFSALDYKTDVVLRKALNGKISDATVIIVAQRISTILHADQIIVLDEGKVVGKGTHEELMQSCETYQEIAKSQLSEKELKGGLV